MAHSPALPQPHSARCVKGELSSEGWLSNIASTSRGKEMGVRFEFRTMPPPETNNQVRNSTLTLTLTLTSISAVVFKKSM
jgi:hypothetical protein